MTLPASKIDPFRHGVSIPIAATGDEACPLASLNNLFTRFPKALNEPLFGIGRKFSRKLVNLEIGQKLGELNIFRPPSRRGFSFRAWAKEMGLSDREIILLGRWKSDVSSPYIHNNVNMILGIFNANGEGLPAGRLTSPVKATDSLAIWALLWLFWPFWPLRSCSLFTNRVFGSGLFLFFPLTSFGDVFLLFSRLRAFLFRAFCLFCVSSGGASTGVLGVWVGWCPSE